MGLLDGGIESPVMPDQKVDMVALRSGNELVGLFDAGCHGLLDENMDALFRATRSHGRMLVVGDGNDDPVQLVLVDHLQIIAVILRPQFIGLLLDPGIDIADRNQSTFPCPGNNFRMLPSNQSNPDHSQSDAMIIA